MIKYILIAALSLSGLPAFAQSKTTRETPVPCNGTADNLPGKYTDHTNPKYPSSLKGTAKDKVAMTNQLIAIEKLEEASRRNFELTGCVARVSFSNLSSDNPGYKYTGYGYQLGIYQNVCHVTEHVVKTVGEYSTVLRININHSLTSGTVSPAEIGIGEFSISKFRYQIPVDAIQGPGYQANAVNNPSRVSKYLSERVLLANRSNNYKDFHTDFLKLNSGAGYTENWIRGDRYGKQTEKSYQWIDRRYLITKPGIPLLIPVSRKQYLQDMLDYLEIEKANFNYEVDRLIKENNGNTSDNDRQRLAVLESDKAAYPKIYETKKEKIKQLLSTKKEEWLQQQAVVGNPGNKYDANERLNDLGKFYDREAEYLSALYVLNPEYFKQNTTQPVKPVFIEVQFRYQNGTDTGYSQRFIRNFEKNFDFDALRKMLE